MGGEAQRPAPLQDAVLRLSRFWADHGCLLLPACDFEVPSGGMHPQAFFRLLEPGAWRAAYVQPVRRPLDGRGGEHPYRLARHLQLQVVAKPPPDDLRRLYLESLEALDLALGVHDVRFADWRWTARSLGGRGAGWHVLLDGLGVTRLTLLGRLAGRELDPPGVEISYGLERLLMQVQGASSAYRVRWSSDGPGYPGASRRGEEELFRYVHEVADPADLRRRVEELEREAELCLEAGLPGLAYELAVRCLEPIDMLEARGDVSARERRGWLGRVRRRVVAAADLHLGQATEPGTAASGAAEEGDGR